MSSPNDVSMEEIPLEDDERDSIEYKILMAYAQRRLSVSKYKKLLKNEANVQKSPSLIRRKAETDHQRDKDGPSRRIVYQGGMIEQHSKKQSRRKYLPGYCLPFLCSRAEQEKSPVPSLQGPCDKVCDRSAMESEFVLQGNSQHQTSMS